MKCPFCGMEMMDFGPAELDQAGDTYLPARKWKCPKHDVTCIVPESMEWKPYPPIGEV